MRRDHWSVGRMMVATAILAVGMAGLFALRSRHDMDDPGVGVLAIFLALILTVVTDEALFGQRHRAFWLGFTFVGWLCAAIVLARHEDTGHTCFDMGCLWPGNARRSSGSACWQVLAERRLRYDRRSCICWHP